MRAVTVPITTSFEMLRHPSEKVTCVVILLYVLHCDGLVTTEASMVHFTADKSSDAAELPAQELQWEANKI